MSVLIGNPEDRFSHGASHIINIGWIFGPTNVLLNFGDFDINFLNNAGLTLSLYNKQSYFGTYRINM